MSDVFICMSAYHVLQALVLGNPVDVIILSMSDLDQRLEKAINHKFLGKVLRTHGLEDYKKNISIIPIAFRYNLRKVVKYFYSLRIKDIYVFNDISPITQYLCQNIPFMGEVIVVEEGIGLYRDSQVRQANLFKLFGKICFGKSFQFIVRQGTSNFVKTIMCHYPQLLNTQQVRKKIVVMPNTNFKEVANELGIKPLNGVDWFIGQPLVEDGVMAKDDYMKIISHLVDKSFESRRNLVIKLHPREDYDKYSTFVDSSHIVRDWKIPMELLIGNQVPVKIYTIYSSAILQLANLNNIQCYLLYEAAEISIPNLNKIFSRINAVSVKSLEELE